MDVRKVSQKRLLQEVYTGDWSDAEVTDLLFQIEWIVEQDVIKDIRKRQVRVPGLKTNGYLSVLGGELTYACRECCLKARWTQLRTTEECQLDCDFCYHHGKYRKKIPEELYKIHDEFFTEDDIKLLFEVKGERLNGVAWLHYEPLMELGKILPLMSFITKKTDCYQWLYTNGILANEETLKSLADAGLDEIRFNLAATDCSDKVLRNMANARKYFTHLCIESPMFTKFYNSFMRKKSQILETGVDHIHFAELQLFPWSLDIFSSEGPIYRYHRGYVSPISSRQLVYDVFDKAAKERWPVVLHDCSNEVKFYRGVHSGKRGAFSQVNYRVSRPRFYTDRLIKNLPIPFYENAIKKYRIGK